MNFFERSQELAQYHRDNRRFLHQHPEIGMNLPETAAYVKKKLKEMGCAAEDSLCGGISVSLGTGNGKTILLRADMDGLPMEEQSGLPFSSVCPDRAHTCGHDMHMSFLLGAARMLKEREQEIRGTVKLVFQPGEETLEGASAMIAEGILENPHVDAAIGIHVQPSLPLGYLNYPEGPFLASIDNFCVEITGKGCHGGQPHMGVDPINIAAHIVLALQSLQVKEVSPDSRCVLNICRIEGGSASNIVPEKAFLWGTLRTYDNDVCERLKARMRDIVESTARMYGGAGKLTFEVHCPSVTNDRTLAADLYQIIEKSGIGFHTDPNYRMQVSDDFGFFSSKIPSVMFVIGCRSEGKEFSHNHSPFVIYDEAVLPVGAALLAHCACEWLKLSAK